MADNSLSLLEELVHTTAKKSGFNAHVLPIKTVGVQGDERSYKNPVIVSGEIDWDEFARFCLDLPNELRQVNRVLYTPGEPLTFEQAKSLTPTLLTYSAIKQSQESDSIMRSIAEQYGFNDSRRCSQMPGILIPSNFGKQGKRSFVIRPCYTHDFMAIIGMMPSCVALKEYPEEYFPLEMFLQMVEEIPQKVDGIERVILDPTDKPPASTEWE